MKRSLSKRHRIVPISTRRYYAGGHEVSLQVNGQPLGSASFELAVE